MVEGTCPDCKYGVQRRWVLDCVYGSQGGGAKLPAVEAWRSTVTLNGRGVPLGEPEPCPAWEMSVPVESDFSEELSMETLVWACPHCGASTGQSSKKDLSTNADGVVTLIDVLLCKSCGKSV